ncbi:M23/M56 family metallopeptidase [Marinoscillum furvescens]|nr:M23/M56 family metallopeptidase [Marinoscillum furvescens]
MPLALVIPTLRFAVVPLQPVEGAVHALYTRSTEMLVPIRVEQAVEAPGGFSWLKLIGLVYLCGVLIMLVRFLINLFRITNFTRLYEQITSVQGSRVFRTSLSQPFSFFSNIFLPAALAESEQEMVKAHELQHIRFRHSWDRMLVDFILVLFWFNPFMYLLRKLLIEVHEFQVDAVMAQQGAKASYQLALLRVAGGDVAGPVSFFGFSILKKRIHMMNRNQSSKYSLLRYATAVPVVALLLTLFSFEMRLPQRVEQFMPTALQTEEGIPSIFPVSTTQGRVRVSSTFGYRKDPFNGGKKFHKGMDIAAIIGTSVFATADGTVISAKHQPKGYGKNVIIQHADGYKTRYAQLDSYKVKVGDRVKKHQVIGEVGSSGRSTAPHLHYEVSKDDKPLDPKEFIQDYKFEKDDPVKSFGAVWQPQKEGDC